VQGVDQGEQAKDGRVDGGQGEPRLAAGQQRERVPGTRFAADQGSN